VVAPGTKVVLSGGEEIITSADPSDPAFGGIYASAALARDDLNYRLRLEKERDEAERLADAKPSPGVNLRLAGVSFGVGLAAGGAAAALVVDGKTGLKAAAVAGSAALGTIVVWLFTR
jgi:hypothetical protein